MPAQCRRIITSDRCCVEQGQLCTNDLQCCGYMMCTGGRCACQAQGRSCQNNNECCAGLACQSGVCRAMADAGADVRTDGTVDGARDVAVDVRDGAAGEGGVADAGDGGMCLPLGRACMMGQACCGDATCGQQPSGSNTCCRNAGGACTAQLDCCGWQLCQGGRCTCRAREASCITDADCCGGARCNRPMGMMSAAGTCACRRELEQCTSNDGCCSGLECRSGRCLTPGCIPPGDDCALGDGGAPGGDGGDAAATVCCSGFECGAQPAGINRKCCRPPALTTTDPPVPCRSNLECCGTVLCTNGACVCRRANETCLRDIDCCGSMLCNRPMGSTMGTCRCQARGQLCRTGGNDCCPGTTCTAGTCQ